MARNIKQVPFPDFLLKTPCVISLHEEKLSEDGGPVIHKGGIEKSCIFSEHAKRVIGKDGKYITLSGKVIVKGDIAPKLKTVSSGTIRINESDYEIHAGRRPRNPDGTVHHTEFEVI